MTKGAYTTEFWLTIFGLTVATVLLAMGKIPIEAWTTVMSVTIPGYTVGRGIAKMNTSKEKNEEP